MVAFSSLDRLRGLVGDGRLRLIYVLAPPRTNSTFVAKLLARPLDAALYEPALPAGPLPLRHHVGTILHAYARFSGHGEPVTLVVKDISVFVGRAMSVSIFEMADHIVFTIRDPLPQHFSLHARLREEFTLAQRFRALKTHPWMTFWYGAHMSYLWPKILWQARKDIPFLSRDFLPASSLAFNLAAWRATVAHHRTALDRLPAERITVIDAGLSRLSPAQTEAELAAISMSIAPPGAAAIDLGAKVPVEIAAHSLMDSNSHWAARARSSKNLSPLEPQSARLKVGPDNSEANRIIDVLYPLYGELFYAKTHRARARLQGLTGRPGFATLQHLALADDAEGAIRALRQ